MSDTGKSGVMSHSGKTRVAGVMGWPVSHSKSPRLHGYWLNHHGIDGAYVPLPVQPDNIRAAVRGLSALGFAGANVTVPHKEAVIGAIDRVTETAVRIGAVNTIIVEAGGTLRGDNTDAFGFIENLKHGADGFAATAAPALVLGAGGAARAVCVALMEAGCPKILVTNRTQDRAAELKASLGGPLEVIAWADRAAALADAGLLVNATSLGMTNQPPLEVALDRLPKAAIVNDLVYAPLETPLLADARRRGNPTVDGLGMLLYQAQAGFLAWFGVKPEVTAALRAHVLGGG